jgi:SOS regulatory protein LexA
MLTKRQKEVVDYIGEYKKKRDYAPSFEEIRKHLKLASVSTVHFHIKKLEDLGYLRKEDNQPRAIDVFKSERLVEIPLLGTIAAGIPIEAIETNDTISVAKDDIGRVGDHYALRVQGNSMIDDGIYDGDLVVIRRQETADDGETVVAVVNNNEATLKRIYREKDGFRLQPANPSLFPIYTKEVEIRGVVVKIIRNFQKQIDKQVAPDKKLHRRIDDSWDFGGAKTKPYTHGFHTYPAMFIPQVARRLLLTYSQKGDTICDIFCGSGTALIESRILGRNSYGIDLNPLAIFLAQVKTTPVDPSALSSAYLKLIARIGKIKDNEVKPPKFKNIEFWYKPKVIIELAKIKKAIKEIKDEGVRNFFLVAFSETARKVSNMKGGEFKMVRIKEDALKKYNPDVIGIFKKRTEASIQGMVEYYKDVDKKTKVKVIYGDSSKTNGIKDGSIDCIITSPPYGDSRTTVAYGQFSRLSAQWVDIFEDPDDAPAVDGKLLGGKASQNLSHALPSDHLKETLDAISARDEKRAKEVLSFYIDLNKCLERAYEVLKPKKYFCLVIGNRLVKQIRIPTDFIIAELAEKIGFTCEDILVRNIPGKRMPSKNSPTNIIGELEDTMTKESIVILRKN